MGWWGFNVMEGDPALDAKDAIQKMVLGRYVGLDGKKRDADLASVALSLTEPHYVTKALALAEGREEADIAVQVLGHMVMASGGDIAPFKDRLLAAIDADEWAGESFDRANAMKAFRSKVETYVEDMPVRFGDKGLLEAVAEHNSKGRKGLVNKF